VIICQGSVPRRGNVGSEPLFPAHWSQLRTRTTHSSLPPWTRWRAGASRGVPTPAGHAVVTRELGALREAVEVTGRTTDEAGRFRDGYGDSVGPNLRTHRTRGPHLYSSRLTM
jgi:hypothetical protein